MKITSFLFVTCLVAASLVSGQAPEGLKEIKGRTFIAGDGYQYEIQDWRMHYLGLDTAFLRQNRSSVALGEIPAENNPDKQVTVFDFYIGETEVSNAQYREFLLQSTLSQEEQEAFRKKIKKQGKEIPGGVRAAWQPVIDKAIAAGLMPDTACWQTDFVFAFNDPLVRNYHWHPAFDDYPVVGVSWDQANAYCNWLTESTNRERAKHGKAALPAFRLPTEMEWELAASKFSNSKVQGSDIQQATLYPWGDDVRGKKGLYMANFKTGHGDYIGDNYGYTAPVHSFTPQANGLYHIGGNVAEWVMDHWKLNKAGDETLQPRVSGTTQDNQSLRVVKGGSWADYALAARPGSRTFQAQNKGSSRVGFRVAMTKTGE